MVVHVVGVFFGVVGVDESVMAGYAEVISIIGCLLFALVQRDVFVVARRFGEVWKKVCFETARSRTKCHGCD